MELKDVKTLITSGTIIIAVILYMVFSEPVKEDETTNTTETEEATGVSDADLKSTDKLASIISVSDAENATNNQAIEVDYIKAYDGDTIQVELNGQKEKIRMLMIDSPEMHDKEDGEQPYAQEATDLTTALMENAEKLEIVYDVGPETDNYDRILAYVFVDGLLVQEELLENGLAAVRYIHKPNNTLEQEFRDLQQNAEDVSVNIWSQEDYFQKDGFHPEVIQ